MLFVPKIGLKDIVGAVDVVEVNLPSGDAIYHDKFDARGRRDGAPVLVTKAAHSGSDWLLCDHEPVLFAVVAAEVMWLGNWLGNGHGMPLIHSRRRIAVSHVGDYVTGSMLGYLLDVDVACWMVAILEVGWMGKQRVKLELRVLFEPSVP